MLTAAKIYEYLRMNNLPYWKLFRVTDINRVALVSDFKGETFKEGADLEEQVNAAIDALSAQLSLFDQSAGTKFMIKARPSKGLNNTTEERDPGFFTIVENSAINPGNQQFNGLGGMPQSFAPLGYVPQDVVDMKLGAIRLETENLIQTKLNAAKEAELSRREAEVNSTDNRYGKRLGIGFLMALDKFLDLDGENSLSGAAQETEEETTEKDLAIEDLAAFINENLDNVEDIKIISRIMKQQIKRGKDGEKVS